MNLSPPTLWRGGLKVKGFGFLNFECKVVSPESINTWAPLSGAVPQRALATSTTARRSEFKVKGFGFMGLGCQVVFLS